jgi:hypothetical protein
MRQFTLFRAAVTTGTPAFEVCMSLIVCRRPGQCDRYFIAEVELSAALEAKVHKYIPGSGCVFTVDLPRFVMSEQKS